MFDIAFSELLLVGLIALLVLGPERLPGAARKAGILFGRIKRSFASVREDVEREIGADELRLQLHNEAILEKERKALEETLAKTKDTLEQGSQTLQQTLNEAKTDAESNTDVIEQSPRIEPSKHESNS